MDGQTVLYDCTVWWALLVVTRMEYKLPDKSSRHRPAVVMAIFAGEWEEVTNQTLH